MDEDLVIGFTAGVFDMFHVGHLNILRRAKEKCDYLIVGVSTDELVMDYKQKRPIVPFDQRCAIVEAIRYVDRVVPQENMDKMALWSTWQFHRMFVGDDWKNTEKWNRLEVDFKLKGCEIVYFSRTAGVSSTEFTRKIQ